MAPHKQCSNGSDLPVDFFYQLGVNRGACFNVVFESIRVFNIFDLHKNLGMPRVLTPLLVWFVLHLIVQLPFMALCPIVENLVDKNQTETFIAFYRVGKQGLRKI